MIYSNPTKSSPVTTSVEIGSEDVLEVTPDVGEVMSMLSKGKRKGKEKGKEEGKEKGKGKAMKWASVKPCTY